MSLVLSPGLGMSSYWVAMYSWDKGVCIKSYCNLLGDVLEGKRRRSDLGESGAGEEGLEGVEGREGKLQYGCDV